MRSLLVLFVFVPAVALCQARTQEILLTTTATALPQLFGRRAMLIENRGPNAIWCAFGGTSSAVVNKAHRIGPSTETGNNRFPYNGTEVVYCIAETANQVTGAATVVSEVP